MEKRNLLKIVLIVLLIVLAGIFYSCRGVKEPDTTISLQDKAAGQTAEELTEVTAPEELTDGKVLTADELKSHETAANNTEGHQASSESEAGQRTDKTTDATHAYIYIHICGAVKKPDVYEVDEDTRLVDVIKLAGGLTKDAAGDYVNQAASVLDGQKVYIPTREEVKDLLPDGLITSESSDLNSIKDNSASNGNTDTAGSTASASKVNINKASAEELMTLAGIGESKAESIITYRQEHGSFKSIEEIKNISGIKDSVFNKISEMITVN